MFDFKSEKIEKIMITTIKMIQNMLYGSYNVFPNFTKNDWSIESFCGKVIKAIK